MSSRIDWTVLDPALRRLRDDSAGVQACADALDVPRRSVSQRIRHLGLPVQLPPKPLLEHFEWTALAEQTLRQMWDSGVSARLIGERLGVGKNSIVSKVHRLKLTPRPSPVRTLWTEAEREAGRQATIVAKRAARAETAAKRIAHRSTSPVIARPRRASRATAPVLAPKPSPAAARPVVRVAPANSIAPAIAPQPALRSVATHIWAKPLGRVVECQWVDGDGPFVCCTEMSLRGRLFCDRHAQRAYAPRGGGQQVAA